jgi:hypothetical protein
MACFAGDILRFRLSVSLEASVAMETMEQICPTMGTLP